MSYRISFLGRMFVFLLVVWVVDAPADEPLRVRVLSYNIHHGEGVDGKFDLERIAKVIRQAEPDLVSLQEVDRKTARASGVDQPAELARLTGLTAVFEKNIEYQGGEYGNAILSRWKVQRHANHPLPSFYKGEQRGVLEVLVEPEDGKGKRIRFLATHLDYRPADGERLASVETIAGLVQPQGDQLLPTLLAGDLNALPESAVLQAFRRQWQVAATENATPTFPAPLPTRQIDFVLAYPADGWKVLEVRALDEPTASDHRPFLAVLEYVRSN